MLKRIFAGLFVALCAASQAFGEERTAISPCDELTAIGSGCTASSGDTGTGHWNSDGSYTDRSGATIDGAGRGRASSQPYVNFQTSDDRFNKIMNLVENDPSACASERDADYAYAYIEAHPELCDAVSRHALDSAASVEDCDPEIPICWEAQAY